MSNLKKRAIVIEVLEPRLLFSADVFAGAMDTHAANTPTIDIDDAIESTLELQQISHTNSAPLEVAESSSLPDDSSSDEPSGPVQPPAPHTAHSGTSLEVVFVDTNTPDYQALLDNLLIEDSANRQFDIVLIEHDDDGLELISETLAQYQNLDAIHIIAHGDDARLELGTNTLDSDSIVDQSDAIANWSKAFTDSGDILIYGCDLAATEVGKSLVDTLGELTNTDVAASIDRTGSAELSGNWSFEYDVGEVSTKIAFSENLQSTWNYTLGTVASNPTLISHWAFDTDASDSSGNTYDGVLTGDSFINTTDATDKIGPAKLELDGTGDYVNLDSDVTHFSALTEGTISAWVNLTDTSENVIFGISDKDEFTELAKLSISSGELKWLNINDSGGYVIAYSDTTVNDGNWHHVAVSVGASGNTLYIDGVAVSTTYAGGSSSDSTFFSDITDADAVDIGRSVLGGSEDALYTGLLDDVRVYGEALTATDIAQLYADNAVPVAFDDPSEYETVVLAEAPVGYWQLGEASGTTAVNLGSNGIDGTYVNSPTLGVTGTTANTGNSAVDFDGTDDHVNLGTLDVDGTGITLSAWINVDDYVEDEQRIISKAESTGAAQAADHTWMLSTISSGSDYVLRFRLAAGGTTDTLIASTGDISVDQWHFVAATYDDTSDEMKLFLNGVEVGSRTHSVGGSVDKDPTQTVMIGANPTSTKYFDGSIDEVAVYEKALTQTQLQTIQAGSNATYLVDEDSTLTVSAAEGVLANDTDEDGDSLTAVLVTAPSNADSFTLNADGSFSYTGTTNFNGTDTFTYRADDGTDQSAIATATITVDSINDAPEGADKTLTITEDTPYTFTTADFGFSDVDGNDLARVWITSLPSDGQLLYNGSTFAAGNFISIYDINPGSLTYEPAANANGSSYASFDFQVQDDGGTTSGGLDRDTVSNTITFDVNATNDPGSIDTGLDTFVGEFGGQTSLTYIGKANDFADNRIVVDLNQTYDLSVVATAANVDPSEYHYLGFASYDSDGLAITAIYYGLYPGSTNTTLAVDLVPGATEIVLTDATGWHNGASSNGQALAWYGYTNSDGYSYADYTYTRNVESNIWDAGAISGNTITLNSPWAGPTLTAGQAVGNAYSPGGTYQYSLLSNGAIPATPTTYNTTIGGGVNPDGSFSNTLFRPGTVYITPLVLANYTDTSTELTISDFTVTSNTGTTIFTEGGLAVELIDSEVQITDIDDLNTESVTIQLTNAKIGDILNVNETAINALGISVIGIPSGALTADGTITLTMTSDTANTVTHDDYESALAEITFENTSQDPDTTDRVLTFVQNDGDDDSVTESLIVQVHAVDDAPLAVADSFTANEGSTTNLNLASNDSGLDDDLDLTSISIISASTNGSIVINANGTVDYTHDGTETTSDSFTYSINDVTGASSNTVTVALTITPQNDVPVATGNTVVATEDIPLIIGPSDFSFNDDESDSLSSVTISSLNINGGTLTHSAGAVTVTNGMTITAAELADLTFTSALNDTTISSFIYTVNDAGSGITGATMNINVTAANDAPVYDNSGTVFLTSITEDDISNTGNTVAEIIASDGGDRITDPDSAALEGIAVYQLTSSNGIWEYNTGSGWTAVGTVSGTSSLLLRDTDSLRFVPDGLDSDLAFVSFSAWDQTTGTAGSKVDASTFGGTTAFSAEVETASITVTAVEDVPVATGNTVVATEDIPLVIGPADFSYSDAEDDSLVSVTISGLTLNGGTLTHSAGTVTVTDGMTVTAAELADLTFTSALDGSTDASFTYTVNDAGTGVTAATMNITVNATNDAPDIDGAATVFINEIHYDNTGTDTGEAIEIAAIAGTDLSGWSLVLYNDNGGVVYGTTALSGIVADQGDGYGTYVVNYATNGLQNGDDAVALVDDSNNIVEFISHEGVVIATDGPAIGMTSVDIGVRESTLTPVGNSLQKVTIGTYGTWLANSPNTFGSVNTGQPFSSTALFTVGVNEDEVFTFSASNGHAIPVIDPDADDGSIDPLKLTLSVSNGVLTLGSTSGLTGVSGNASSTVEFFGSVTEVNTALEGLTYQATSNFNGSDILNIAVDDQGNSGTGGALSDSATVDITIIPVNDLPVAIGNTVIATEDVPLVIGAGDFSFTDVESDALASVTITGLTLNGGTLTHSAGAVTVTNGMTVTSAELADLTFTSASNDSTDSSFTYTVNDAGTGVISATMSITVNAVNDAPVMAGSNASFPSINEDDINNSGQTVADLIATIATDAITDADGDPEGIALFINNENDGTWQYKLDGSSTWVDVGSVSSSSALLLSDTDSIRFQPDSIDGGTANIGFRAWDQSSGSNGDRVTIGTSGGESAFSLQTKSAIIYVTDVNDAPVAVADSFTVNEGSTTTINLASNDTDVDDALDLTSITIVSGASNGSIVVNTDGTVDYSHDGSETLIDSFTYTIDDATGATSDTVTVNLSITPQNDVPVATGNTVNANEDIPLVIAPSDFSFTDDESDSLTSVTITGLTLNGGTLTHSAGAVAVTDGMTVTVAELADLTFTSALNDSTDSSFTYTVNDAGTGVTSATMSITVNAANDVPIATGNTVTATEDIPLIIGSSDFTFSDVENDSLTSVTLSGLSLNGGTLTHSAGAVTVTNGMTVTSAELADLTFTSASNDSTDSSFTYTVNDAGSGVTPATMGITVNAANDVPVATGNTVVATEDVPLFITPSDFSFTDVESDSLTSVTITGLTLNGGTLTHSTGAVTITDGMTITAAELADLTFTSALNDSTDSSFTYTVNDAGTGVASAMMSITVNPDNDAPMAIADTRTVAEGSTTTLNLAANDTDIDNGLDLSSIIIISTPTVGTVTVNNDGTVDYAHDGSETTADSFTYTIDDMSGAQSGVVSVDITITPVNDAPVAIGNTVFALEDVPLVINASDFQYSDAELDPLASVAISEINLNGGTLTHSSSAVSVTDGMTITAAELSDLTFTSAAHDSSDSSFSYTVNDANNGSVKATMIITVNPVNDAPIATGESFTIHEGATETLDLANNDVDIDDGLDLASITIVTVPAVGTVTVNNNGTVDYSHDGSDTTSDSFSYRIDDTTGATSNVVVVNLTITPVNDLPVATGNTVIAQEDIPLVISDSDFLFSDSEDDSLNSVTISDLDVNGGSLTHSTGTVTVTNGMTISASELADLTYTSATDDSSDSSFSYIVNDTDSGVVKATMSIIVNPVNDVPVATADSRTVAEGSTTTFSLASNDYDIDDWLDLSSITIISAPDYGSLVVNNDGTITYGHDGSETTSDSFSYTIDDTEGSHSNTVTVDLTITPVNDLAVATGNIVLAFEDVPLLINSSDFSYSDAENNALNSVTISDLMLNGGTLTHTAGTVNVTNGMTITAAELSDLTFTPAANDSTNSNFSYTVNDADSGTVKATMNITVDPVNDAPVAISDTRTVNEGSTRTLSLAANDTDIDDGLDLSSITIISAPTLGTVIVNNNGTVDYAHDGSDTTADSFTYSIDDMSGAHSGVVSVDLTITPVNDPPDATGNTLFALEDVPFVIDANDFRYADAELDPLTSVTISGLNLNGGTLTHSSGTVDVTDGMTITAAELSDLTFTSVANDSSDSSFTYTVNDADLGAVSATMNIIVDAVNDAPVASADSFIVDEHSTTHLNLAANDSDIDDGLDLASINIITAPTLGVLTVNTDGTVDYAHNGSETTSDSFSYTINDLDGVHSDVVDVDLIITPVNDLAVALGNTVYAVEDIPLTINATDFNFSDAENDILRSVTITDLTLNGATLSHSSGTVNVNDGMTVTLAELSDLTFTSAPNASDDASFAYTVNDAANGVVKATMAIVVSADNDAPVAVADSYTVLEDSITALNLVANDSDIDDELNLDSLTITTAPVNGTLVLNNNGTVDYTHDGSETIADSFSYYIDDATGSHSNVVDVTLAVTPVNDLPVAMGNSTFVMEDTPLFFSVSDFAYTDAENDALSSVTITNLSLNGGTLTHSAGSVSVTDGMSVSAAELADLTFTPALNNTDNASFIYVVNDADNAVITATMNILVNADNDAPVANADSYTVDEHSTTNLNLMANDIDIDDGLDPASITIVSDTDHGTVVVNTDGSVDYTHDGSETVSDSFLYSIDDMTGMHSNTVEVALTITPVNDLPIAFGNTLTAFEDLPFVISASDFSYTDAESNPLSSITVTDLALNSGSLTHSAGTVAVTNGMTITAAELSDLTFTSAPNDSQTVSVNYSVNDADMGTVASTLTININPVNDVPIASADAYTVDESSTTRLNLSANDNDIDDGLDLSSIALISSPVHGTIVINPDGSVDYTHDGTETSADSFTYSIKDAAGTLSNTVFVDLTISPVNDLAVATNNTLITVEDQTLLIGTNGFTYTDAEHDPIASISITDLTLNGGTLTHSGGTVDVISGMRITAAELADLSFTPAANDTTMASIDYLINDADDSVEAATLSINITPVNDAPVAVDDSFTVLEGSKTNLNLASNDSDIDDALDLASIAIINSPEHGSIVVNTDGTVDYSHNGTETTSDRFTYSINDASGLLSDTVVVDLDITPVNDLPVATGNSLTAIEDEPLLIGVSAFSYTDAENDALASITVTDLALNGGTLTHSLASVHVTNGMTITAAELADLTFTAAANDSTTATLSYRVNDTDNATEVATLTIDVTPLNDEPVANGNSFSVIEASTTTLDLTSNDQDIDDGLDLTSITVINAPQNGTVLVNNNGTVDYTHNGTETVSDSFIYTIDDNSGAHSNAVTVDLTITAVNDLPIALGNQLFATEDTDLLIPTSDFSFSDAESDALQSITIDNLSLNGGALTQGADAVTVENGMQITVSELTDLTFSPAENSNSDVNFSYTVNDTEQGIEPATMTISIAAINDTPVANGNTLTTQEDVPIIIAASELLYDDVENDPITSVTFTNLALNGGTLSHTFGSVEVSNGMTLSSTELTDLTFTPAPNNNADVSFRYFVNDAAQGTTSGTMEIIVESENDSPIMTSNGGLADASITIFENTTAVTTASAVDNDAEDSLHYAITGGIDAVLFSIDEVSGELALVKPIDFENPIDANQDGLYELSVSAIDVANASDEQQITVTVDDINEAPTKITLSNDLVQEHTETQSGFTVGVLTTTDEDFSDTTTYTIVGGLDAELFSIGGNQSNELVLTDGTLDYEQKTQYVVVVQVADKGDLNHLQSFTVLVDNINEEPIIISEPILSAIAEEVFTYNISTDNIDGDAVTITAVELPAWLTLTDNGDGTAVLTGIPENSDAGAIEIELIVSDGTGSSSQVFTMDLRTMPEVGGAIGTDTELGTSITPDVDLTITGPLVATSLISSQELLQSTTEYDDDQEQSEDEQADEKTTEDTLRPLTSLDLASLTTDHTSSNLILDEAYAYQTGRSVQSSFFDMEKLDLANLNLNQFDFWANAQFGEPARNDMTILSDELDRLSKDITNAISDEVKQHKIQDNLVIGASVSLATVALGWILKGGSLASSFLTVLPVWKQFDIDYILIPKSKKELAAKRKAEEEEDDPFEQSKGS